MSAHVWAETARVRQVYDSSAKRYDRAIALLP